VRYSKSRNLIALAPRVDKRRNTCFATLYSLLRDLIFLNSGAPGLVHNTDIQSQLFAAGEVADFDWITAASDRLAEVERGMRRNLLRTLSLDAFEWL